MLIKEFFMTRPDGINLYRTYSDLDMYIRQIDTGILYEDAVDIENSLHQYEETDQSIPKEEEEDMNVTNN